MQAFIHTHSKPRITNRSSSSKPLCQVHGSEFDAERCCAGCCQSDHLTARAERTCHAGLPSDKLHIDPSMQLPLPPPGSAAVFAKQVTPESGKVLCCRLSRNLHGLHASLSVL